jgi:Na+/H+ antiporter NhaC
MMKTALIFFIIVILIFAGVYYYYLTIDGASLEELFNQAVGLPSEEEGSNGFSIVVSLIPYTAIIAVFVIVGVFLHFSRRKRGKNLYRQG